MKPAKKSDLNLLWAAIALAILSFVPGPWLLPLQFLNTHVHELGHALVALATGGSGITIHVFADGSGLTSNYGGFPFLILQAGYVTATAVGAGLIVASRKAGAARNALIVLGGVVGIGLVVWVRGDIFGVVSGAMYAAALVFLGYRGKDEWIRFAAGFLGIHQAFASFKAFADLVYAVRMNAGENDATLLSKLTGVPPFVWATCWLVLGLIVVFLCLRPSKARSGSSGR